MLNDAPSQRAVSASDIASIACMQHAAKRGEGGEKMQRKKERERERKKVQLSVGRLLRLAGWLASKLKLMAGLQYIARYR